MNALKKPVWECHICREKRPYDKISTKTKSIFRKGKRIGEQYINFCHDKPKCFEGAKTFSFFPKEE